MRILHSLPLTTACSSVRLIQSLFDGQVVAVAVVAPDTGPSLYLHRARPEPFCKISSLSSAVLEWSGLSKRTQIDDRFPNNDE